MEFIEISETSEIDKIVDKSKDKLQVLFKHSTACPISRMSYEKMKNEYKLTNEEADLYYIGVIESRPVSNYIAEKLSVQHESPQMIVVKDGKQVFNESHLMIDPSVLSSFI